MSTHKANRARLNRALRGYNSARTERTKPQAQPIESDPYRATLRHKRPLTRYGWRINLAREEEGTRMSKACRAIIESFESYKLRKKYSGEESYGIGKYLRQYHRRDGTTPKTRDEVIAWYNEHNDEHISRMRKMHAIVGSTHRPILRTE